MERLPKTAAGQICPSAFSSHVLAEIAFSRGASAQNGIAADMPVYVASYICVYGPSVSLLNDREVRVGVLRSKHEAEKPPSRA